MQNLNTRPATRKVGQSTEIVKLLRIQASDTHVVEFDNVDTRFNDCNNWQVMAGGKRVLFSNRMYERFSDVKSGIVATINVCENSGSVTDKAMLEGAKAYVTSNQYHLASLAPSGEEGKALTALIAQKKALQATLPENWHLDFTWLLSWSAEQVNTLLGFCAAHGINGIQERLYNRTDTSELDALEAALDFDLRKWWQPGAESYFGKLTIAQIGKAYEEAGLSARAGEIVKLKRRDAAKAAEQDLNAQGWLPDWMVRPAPAAEAEEATESDADTTDHAA